MRAAVAALLGPQLAMDALAIPTTTLDVVEEAIDELTRALEHDDDIGLRHHRAVVLALRYIVHAGPDDDFQTAHAEFVALLDVPGYQEEAGDLARLMLVQLRAATLRARENRRFVEDPDGAEAARFVSDAGMLPSIVTRAAFSDIAGHLSQMSEPVRSDTSVGSIAALFASISPYFREDHQDEERALDEAIAQATDRMSLTEEGFDRALNATLLALLLNQKASATKARVHVDAAVAAAHEADLLLRDDIPLAPLLRDIVTMVKGQHEKTPVERAQLPHEVAEMRKVLHKVPASDPARDNMFTSFVSAMAIRIGETGDRAGLDDLREFVAEESATIADEGARHLARGMVEVLDGILTEEPSSISAGIASLTAAEATLSPRHRAFPMIKPFIAMALGQRAISGRNLGDLESAYRLIDIAEPGLDEQQAVSAKLGRLGLTLTSLRHGGTSPEKIDAVLEELRGLTAEELRVAQFDVAEVTRVLEFARTLSGSFGKPVTGPAPAAQPNPGYWSGRQDDMTEAAALVHNGFVGNDLEMLDRGVALLREQTTTGPRDRVRMLATVGLSMMFRYARSTKAADLDNAIEQLEEAESLVGHTDASDTAGVHYFLGDALHLRGNRRLDQGDRARAADQGILAMQARAADVLLQSEADYALTTAEGAEGEAANIVQWCVVAGRLDLAVRALELGRALVLNSISVETSIPDLLRDAERPDLAERWQAEATDDDPGPVPSDLRFQVLTALEGTKAESQLLRPPSLDHISTALRSTGSQALVYLLPAQSTQPGFALVVTADGEVRHIPLPKLRSGPVRQFEAARRALVDPSAADEKQWDDAVASMCDWSWVAVMGPLLDHFRGLPRLVLVPVGELGAVAWHAARRRVGGELRYACQDAVLTYAASARQFADAARRGVRQADAAAALVRVSDQSLYWAPTETATIRDHCYPDATCVEDDVLPAAVLSHLPSDLRPGASVLHLTCHACHATPAVDSHLVLDNGQVLPVRDVLRQARHRPADAEGGLVVLASCASDLTDSTQDEALTLATAFLAAGATGVVGARWPIVDITTTFFVIMFHHYLTRGYEDPAVALRAAQLWMLDPGRRLPPGLPRALARRLRSSRLDDAGNWAAFTYQGR
ncbi:CHAT domain-containing protein [Lentzea sp. NPDC051838]|uniref:CHAT domain-containing protein n=1 Tax=Lentzea sp. NPDC051838 TaxID=3154849 RepID=UPI00342A0CF5